MHAQPHGGYANSFSISAARNVSGAYWNDINQAKDGSIVAKPNAGTFTRLTASTSYPIFFGSSLAGINHANIYGFGGNGTQFMVSPGGQLFLKGDSIQVSSDKRMEEWGFALHLAQGALLNNFKEKEKSVTYWNGKHFYPIMPPTELAGRLHDSTIIQRDLVSGKACIVYKDKQGQIHIYRFEEKDRTQAFLASYFIGSELYLGSILGKDSIIVSRPDGPSQQLKPDVRQPQNGYYEFIMIGSQPVASILRHGNDFFMRDIPATGYKTTRLNVDSRPQEIIRDKYYNSYYLGCSNDILRVFPHITQFPALYNNSNSNSTDLLAQAADGTIYAGSYNTGLASITASGVKYIPTTMKFLSGICLNNSLLCFTENPTNLFQYKPSKGFSRLLSNFTTGFIFSPSRDKKQVLAGLAGDSSFAVLDKDVLEKAKFIWEKIGPEQGIRTKNIVSITEDQKGRIFFGRPSQGWGVYYPETKKAETFLIQEQQTSFGIMSSLCDNTGLVWIGSNKGIWVVDARKKGRISPGDAKRIEHALLPDGIMVSSMALWNNYIVAGTGRNLLLIDLKSFYGNPKNPIIRYFNPEETNFTADCEQNTMLVDHRDSSLWMTTSDNLYQFDLKTWLKLPTYKVTPALKITLGEKQYILNSGNSLAVSPTQNSLHIEVAYQSKDNMPRYLQTAFIAIGDSLVWKGASITHSYSFLNLQSGVYTFHLRILQSDGTITTHSFSITIRRFLWQQWWFWFIISCIVISVSFYLFYLHKQKQLAVAEAKQVKAEAEALRSEQQRQLTSMQVKSLSTQFRPHFILNALNTVGAQLYDKPEVDAVLGQLGDSIGIIFRNAQSGAIAHPLSQEWRLVMSVINIKQLELNHAVSVHLNIPENLLKEANIQVPMGILQIPVENALVHGLRNKETGPKDLWISAGKTIDERLCVTILDNGIGRKAAAAIGNYRSNGVGTRNIQAILDLLNPYNEKPITIQYRDEPFEEDGNTSGTEVTICIPQNYSYER